MKSKIESLLKQANSTAAQPSSETGASRVFQTADEAATVFQFVKESLFRIENWNRASEISGFAHFDENGDAQPQKPVAVGSMMKISLPGSGKDDWVKIIEIYDAAEELVITVQPSFDPTAAKDKTRTSHFFVNSSTNNFCLQRKNIRLNFYVIGLGENTNTEESDGFIEMVRNLATSNAGYFLGIQKTQWKTFCENFLADEKR